MEGHVPHAQRAVTKHFLPCLLGASLLAAVAWAGAAAKDNNEKMDVPLDELVFQGVDGQEWRLAELGEAKVYVLAYITNTCPIARRYLPRLVQMEAELREQGVRFVAVNVGLDESLEEVAAHQEEFEVPFPMVKDASGDAARALGMTRTPEVAVLDTEGVLRYRGRVDDQYRLGGVRPTVTSHDLKDAIEAVLAGHEVDRPRVPADGCRITLPSSAPSGGALD